jgi:hypothetical protein
MDELLRAVAVQLAWIFLPEVVAVVATVIGGWVAALWARLFKAQLEESTRKKLHEALHRGMLQMIQQIAARKGYVSPVMDRDALLDGTVGYVRQFSPSAAQKFKLSDPELAKLAQAHLPLPAGIVMPATSDRGPIAALVR